MDGERRHRLVRRVTLVCLAMAVVLGGSIAMTRLESHINQQLLDRFGQPIVAFIDLPDSLTELALDDLEGSVANLLTHRDWTDDGLCRDTAGRLASVAWIANVNAVHRTAYARFEVSARYRVPTALVQFGSEFILIDGDGVRLPGTYLYDPAWMLIQGVSRVAPPAGVKWEGDDLQAGLAIAAAMTLEPYRDQITAVLVENMGGRLDMRRSHVELATDRAGGRIRWGSAPGFELEENTVEHKLALLRENYRRTGRADASHPVIDISTFPDGFTIPG